VVSASIVIGFSSPIVMSVSISVSVVAPIMLILSSVVIVSISFVISAAEVLASLLISEATSELVNISVLPLEAVAEPAK
jgi:hypothetical protein